MDEQSTFDWRRYGQWSTSAKKARHCVFALWRATQPENLAAVTSKARYADGDGSLAIWESFRRESAVAMELIVKAVIAQQLQLLDGSQSECVPSTHDVPALWREARLPELEREDLYRLFLIKLILIWSGRYATPRTAKA